MIRGRAGIRTRSTLGATIAVMIALLAGAVLLVTVHRRQLTSELDGAARVHAADLATLLADGALPTSLAVRGAEEALVQILDPTGKVVAASQNISGELPVAPDRPAGGRTISRQADRLPIGDGPFLLVARGVDISGATYTVLVASSLGSVDASVRSLTTVLVLGLPLLLVMVSVTTWIVVGRALRPVEAIRSQTASITADQLHRRVPEPPTTDEIGRLARTMNAMLDRLDRSAQQQQRFVADASHEFRSPLSSIRQQLEVELRDPDHTKWPSVASDVLDETMRLELLLDNLLFLARDDATSPMRATAVVDLDDIVLEEVHRATPADQSKVIDATHVSAAQVRGNADELRRVIRNLLENAVRHADHDIKVALGETASESVVLRVADDGLGILPEHREVIFERFVRLDESRARNEGGAGLGLAIAREVVRRHGGTLEAEVSSGGVGAQFVIRLPSLEGRVIELDAGTRD